MSSDDENYGTVNPAAHKKLLSEINEIVKFQHVKKPFRSEPALKKNSEFHLVKSKPNFEEDEDCLRKAVRSSKKSVSISHVAQTVQKNTKQKQISKQLKNAFKSDNVLSKPLEKIFTDKIGRTVAYDNTRARLGRWDAIVTKNQNAEQLKFPIPMGKVSFNQKDKSVTNFRYKTKLMKELEDIHNECFPQPVEVETDKPTMELLSLEEMKEKRKELARLKLKESHKIAKKRMQGKIKSKKYHKLKKREEIKRKMKEFEDLKVTNPELALKELEKIDKQRVKERTTLRHKNTGTWAKNLQVRAKYDENVRQDLEAQLAIGRELTQKNRQVDSSDSESDNDIVAVPTKGIINPWMGVKENGNELDEVFSGYKKFWDEHNKNQKKVKDVKNEPEDLDNESEDSGEEIEDTEVNSEESYQSSELSRQDSDEDGEKNSKFINDLFDEAEEKITSKMESKLTELKPKLLETNGKNKKSVSKKRNNFNDARNLGFEKKARLGDVDEALMEGDDKANENFNAPSWKLLKEVKRKKKEKESFMKGSGDINPNSFLSVQSKHLLSAIPISQVFDDIDDEVDVKQLSRSNKMSLAEAFEDDDIMNDFKQEVEDEFKKKLAPEDTALPGWGNWGGCGVKAKKPRPETKILEVKKKDRIIISSALNEKLQKHLISSVPFPFKSVQDFEASMRLPIGKDFIPETAHRKLTLPSIVTKAGAVIEPMTEETLVQQKGGLKNKFLKKGKKVKKLKK